MLKLIQTLLLTCVAFSVYAQALEKVYQNHERKEITKERFEALEYEDAFIPAYYKEGNKLISYLIYEPNRTVIDKISQETLEELREYLSSLTGNRYHKSKSIVIDYYPGKDRSNEHINTTFYKRNFIDYRRGLSGLPHINQICIRKKGSDLGKWEGTSNWIEDADGFIEKTFFPHHYLHASMIVIKPDGSFVKRYGQYELQRSLKEITLFTRSETKRGSKGALPKM